MQIRRTIIEESLPSGCSFRLALLAIKIEDRAIVFAGVNEVEFLKNYLERQGITVFRLVASMDEVNRARQLRDFEAAANPCALIASDRMVTGWKARANAVIFTGTVGPAVYMIQAEERACSEDSIRAYYLGFKPPHVE